MGDEDRLLAGLDRVQRRLVTGVRDVDRDPEPVHSAHGLAPEFGEPTVPVLAQTTAEGVRLAVRDARRPDAEAIEDVETIDLVLDGCRCLERRDERDLLVLL